MLPGDKVDLAGRNGLGSPLGIETPRGYHRCRSLFRRRNGLGSPLGIETQKFLSHGTPLRFLSEWPGKPVRD